MCSSESVVNFPFLFVCLFIPLCPYFLPSLVMLTLPHQYLALPSDSEPTILPSLSPSQNWCGGGVSSLAGESSLGYEEFPSDILLKIRWISKQKGVCWGTYIAHIEGVGSSKINFWSIRHYVDWSFILVPNFSVLWLQKEPITIKSLHNM